jgi:putative photosynthetic complex assembly protein 2
MTAHDGLPLLYAVLVWFVSTGVIIWLDGLPKRTFRWSFAAASVVAVAAVIGVARSAADASAMGAYLGFTCALAVWGWHEMSFLMGIITGPRKAPCPPHATGWTRFKLAAATLIYHEIALALTAVALVALSWGQPNQTAAATFAILFVMRLSTKLNIFIGVPNLTVDFLPDHLGYLKSYFRTKQFNWLFPVSIAVSTVMAMLLGEAALGLISTDGNAVGLTLLFALVALAVLEHWFLVLPLPDAALWRWAMTTKAGQAK